MSISETATLAVDGKVMPAVGLGLWKIERCCRVSLNLIDRSRNNQIEKEVHVEADEELLKKVEDPMEKIRK